MQTFFYICEYFDISPKEFFDVDITAPVKFHEALKELKKLDAEHLELIIAFAKGMQIPNKTPK